MLNDTLIELKNHGPEAKVFYPDQVNDQKSPSVKAEITDENWRNAKAKISSILVKNIFLKLVKKVYIGALPSDEVIKALKMVADLDIESQYCPKKVNNIVFVLEKIIEKNHLGHEVDEIREMISSLKFFAKTCDSLGGK